VSEVKLYLGDCLDILPTLGEVDVILTDLPYGTTACKWDEVIPFKPMWKQVKRICKGAFVTTADEPFTSFLVVSNVEMFKYKWNWNKVNRKTGHLDAKRKPLKVCEDICVFYVNRHIYNPQMTQGKPYKAISRGRKSNNYSKQKDGVVTENKGFYYPLNQLNIKADERGTVGRIHPTQKPVALYEYLVRTYTNPGNTVLDFCMGSGTTGVACVQLGRNFIGIEKEPKYYEIAEKRIEEAQQQLLLFT